jgi:alkaline phosphatase D
VKYRDPKTGELLERKGTGRPDLTPVGTFPGGSSIETIEGACPGAAGEVRVRYRQADAADWQSTEWEPVIAAHDFARQFGLSDLEPGGRYVVAVESRAAAGGEVSSVIEGRFRTAPAVDKAARVVFTVTTGTAYGDQDLPGQGYKMYGQMLKLDPSFFVHTGDILYYDRLAKTPALARWHWDRMYSLPTNVDFHRQVSSYFIKDDHDTWMNDCWPTRETKFMGEFTFAQGVEIFPQEVPMGEKTWRTVRWGKDLQVWLPEGRDYRSANTMEDGPEKTIWGAEQKAWFKRTVAASDATFKVVISPTPIVGPDRTNKNDNHSNKGFTHEGDEIRRFIAGQKNMVTMCGDRHWQYVSVDKETGVKEFSCGPASNEHAGGWKDEFFYEEHKYLKVIGGFLAATVERVDGVPTLTCRHYGVDGEILNEDRTVAE